MTDIITQVAAIQVALHHFKEQIPPDQWDTTPLPIIAAPRAWMEELSQSLGQEPGMVPETIHGCSVVQHDGIGEPALVTHDGKAYKLSSLVDRQQNGVAAGVRQAIAQ